MFPCQRTPALRLTRREMLTRCAGGFGALALSALFRPPALASDRPLLRPNQLAPRPPHYPAKVRNIIFLYMDGGPSQVDTFDPKPRLTAENGRPFGLKMEPTQFNNIGMTLGSPWPFKPFGQSGIPVSSLFPYVAECVDDLAVIRSMTSEFSEHTSANYFLHTGSGLQGRPSIGAWLGYGLGTENANLPGFVVLNGGLIPPGGLDNFNSGFLPATYQGSIFIPGTEPVANIRPTEATTDLQIRKLALMGKLDRRFAARAGSLDQVESSILNAELAFRMQTAVPELMATSGESDLVKKMYGFEAPMPQTRIFAQQCLQARRLVQRGVRFVELTCPSTGGDRWDQHGKLTEGHENNARAVDQPIAGLLRDLKATGLWESTLVVWAGEFGRTPFAQGKDGRDHNPFGFTIWLAGGGIKGGTIHGATDDYGYKAVDQPVTIHDLHATMLHLLGLDHTKLTFRYSGRDMRLTDVHGEIIQAILS
jgi:Protein of unknown function (DUF1501)